LGDHLVVLVQDSVDHLVVLGSLVDQDQVHLDQALLELILHHQVDHQVPVLVVDLAVLQVGQDQDLVVPQAVLVLVLVVPLAVLVQVLEVPPVPLVLDLVLVQDLEVLVVLLELLQTAVDLGHLVLYQALDPQTKIPLISLLEYPEVVADQVALDLDDHLLEDHPLVTCHLQVEDHMADNYTI